jgi:hypothetical protein
VIWPVAVPAASPAGRLAGAREDQMRAAVNAATGSLTI